jgi:glucose uptake protein GlcU
MSTEHTVPDSPAAKQTVIVQYDPEPRRDSVRAIITIGLVAGLFVVIGFALYSTHGDYEKTKDILDKLLPALTGLIGSALGFYFGSKATQN